MVKVRCLAGRTQIRKLLRHALKETNTQKVDALVFVGDVVEEDIDELAKDIEMKKPHFRTFKRAWQKLVDAPADDAAAHAAAAARTAASAVSHCAIRSTALTSAPSRWAAQCFASCSSCFQFCPRSFCSLRSLARASCDSRRKSASLISRASRSLVRSFCSLSSANFPSLSSLPSRPNSASRAAAVS
mgnify:CR=1 FL=1